LGIQRLYPEWEVSGKLREFDRNACVYKMFIFIGKATPLQAWTDPEGSRRLKLPDFKTIGT
jgi:hypothetical protein